MVNRAGLLSAMASQPLVHYALLLASEAAEAEADGAPLRPSAVPAAASPAACASCSTSSASAASSTGLPRAGSAAPSVSATTARYGRPCVDRRTVAGWEARPCPQPSGWKSSRSGGRNSGEKPHPWSMQHQCFGTLAAPLACNQSFNDWQQICCNQPSPCPASSAHGAQPSFMYHLSRLYTPSP